MQFLYSGITSGSIYALVALGFNIIYNTTGIINFAQGEFVMLGGMFLYTTLVMAGLPLIIAIVISITGAFLLGMMFETVFIKFVKVKSEINLITITIAASIILRGIAMIIWGRDSLGVPPHIKDVAINLPGGVLNSQSLLVIIVSLATAFVLSFFFKQTKYGKAFRACHDDQIASQICGINVSAIRMASFGIAAVLGCIGGIVMSPITFATYNDGVMAGLKGFSAAIFGGLGNFWGAIAGGLLLGIFEGFSATVIPSGYKDAMAFLIILLILFVKPSGLFGKSKVKRV
jgi:branched-chain amino acid transport system permease protein